MKDGKYGIGILGLGGRGVFFGGMDFEQDGGFRVVCVCDLVPEKVRAAQKIFGEDVGGYTDVDAFLRHEGLDAVVVATPDFAHADCAVAVLKARKNLFLEKPMAQTIEDCDRIIDAWKGSGTVFMVGLELRYCTLMQELKALLDRGEVGRILIGTVVDNVSVGGEYYYHGARRKQEYIKSLLLEKGTHSLDLANWLVQGTPTRVYATGALDVFGGNEPNDKHCRDCEKRTTCPYFIDADRFLSDYGELRNVQDLCVYAQECDVSDNSLVLIDYDNGAKLSYMECHFTPEYTREFMFVGEKGKVEAFYNNEQEFKIKLWKRHEKEPVYIYPPKAEVFGSHGGGDAGIIRAFREKLDAGIPCMPGIKGARDSAAIAIAAYQSEKAGTPLMIPAYDYPEGVEI